MFFAHHWPEIVIAVVMSIVFSLWIVKNAEVSMRLWQDFLDSLSTDGGHLLLLSVFVLICCAGLSMAAPLQKYEGELIGALLMGLKATGSNKSRRDTPLPPATTSTSTTVTTASQDASAPTA